MEIDFGNRIFCRECGKVVTGNQSICWFKYCNPPRFPEEIGVACSRECAEKMVGREIERLQEIIRALGNMEYHTETVDEYFS